MQTVPCGIHRPARDGNIKLHTEPSLSKKDPAQSGYICTQPSGNSRQKYYNDHGGGITPFHWKMLYTRYRYYYYMGSRTTPFHYKVHDTPFHTLLMLLQDTDRHEWLARCRSDRQRTIYRDCSKDVALANRKPYVLRTSLLILVVLWTASFMCHFKKWNTNKALKMWKF